MPASIYARPARLSSTFRNTEYLKPGDLALLLPFSRGTIDRMIAAGELPDPDIIRPCLRLWRKETIMPAIRSILEVKAGE